MGNRNIFGGIYLAERHNSIKIHAHNSVDGLSILFTLLETSTPPNSTAHVQKSDVSFSQVYGAQTFKIVTCASFSLFTWNLFIYMHFLAA